MQGAALSPRPHDKEERKMNSEIMKNAYVLVDVPADGVTDVSDAIQAIIDANPNRTLFFPDGMYRLNKPICTPADPARSVSLKLADFAVLQASPDWDSEEAIVRLGAIHPANNIYQNGSNYSLSGGIIDGNFVAKGVSIDGGRETVVRDLSIKHTTVGLHIKHGANSGSSDSDISGVNITGTGKTDSVGVLIEGYDNTLTNMRIARVQVGVHLKSGGNALRNIHPLYSADYTDYQNACAFWDESTNNWYYYCYSDQYGVGFRLAPCCRSLFDGCFVFWYGPKGETHTAVRADRKFNGLFTNLRVGFNFKETKNVLLGTGESGGCGVLDRVIVREDLLSDDTYKDYLKNGIFPY